MASSAADLTSRLLRHERVLLAGIILLLCALSWMFLLRDAGMEPMQAMQAMQPPLTALILMWWVMMVAMMLPSATPAILLYAEVRHSRSGGSVAIGKPWVFLLGYLAVWLLFSIGAALAQWLLIDASMSLQNQLAQAAVLVAAGSYQLSPFKSACLSQCRSPGQFISRHWRPGWGGAMRLGLIHGSFCVGCCWMLMTLLFVGGVMNLLWVLGLTALIAAEKLLPSGRLLEKVSGAALIGWGVAKALG